MMIYNAEKIMEVTQEEVLQTKDSLKIFNYLIKFDKELLIENVDTISKTLQSECSDVAKLINYFSYVFPFLIRFKKIIDIRKGCSQFMKITVFSHKRFATFSLNEFFYNKKPEEAELCFRRNVKFHLDKKLRTAEISAITNNSEDKIKIVNIRDFSEKERHNINQQIIKWLDDLLGLRHQLTLV